MSRSIVLSGSATNVIDILNCARTTILKNTKPKDKLPIDVYLCCTKAKPYMRAHTEAGKHVYTNHLAGGVPYFNGRVVAKFTLNTIEDVYCEMLDNGVGFEPIYYTDTLDDIEAYFKPRRDGYVVGYVWYVDNLIVFDEPKKLSEFKLNTAPKQWCYIKETINKKSNKSKDKIIQDIFRTAVPDLINPNLKLK